MPAAREHQSIELKQSWRDEYLKWICAFANAEGGTLIIGRNDEGVANAFFRAGEIEAWGRGIQRIFTACREAETPEPRILYEPDDLWFEFSYSATYLEIIPGGAGRRGFGEKDGEKVGEKVGERLTANQQGILELLIRHPRMAAPELSDIVGISKRKIEKNIAYLKKFSVVRLRNCMVLCQLLIKVVIFSGIGFSVTGFVEDFVS